MQNNLPKTLLILSVLSLCVFSACFIYFFKVTNENNTSAREAEMAWQEEFASREELNKLDTLVKNLEGERAEIETHFARGSNIVPFLDTIENLALQVTIKAEVTSIDTPKNDPGLMVGLKASGSFNNIYKLLTLLENSQYELEFTSIDIRKGAEVEAKKGAVANWDALFKLRLLTFIK